MRSDTGTNAVTRPRGGGELKSESSTVGRRWIVPLLAFAFLTSQAQSKTDTASPLPIPHTTEPLLINCTDNTSQWRNAPRIYLSKDSVASSKAEVKGPPTLLFSLHDPSKAVSIPPPEIQSKLDSFHAQYAFQWTEGRLYGYVEIKEKGIDAGHPKISEDELQQSSFQAAFEDLFYSTVVVEVGAPSWQRWISEMHVHVRAPNAKPIAAAFYGRTNDEEAFKKLAGEAIACPTKDGWIAKFAVDWLPFGDWQPKLGQTADIRLLAPLDYAHEGFGIATVVPFVLSK